MISNRGSDENRLTSFLVKLWSILETDELSKVICWDVSGKSFQILDVYSFCEDVLPRFFKHKNMASFIRQLNLYGFKKITSIDRCTQDNLNDNMQFAHPCFIRDHPHLLKNIKRNYTASRRPPQSAQQFSAQLFDAGYYPPTTVAYRTAAGTAGTIYYQPTRMSSSDSPDGSDAPLPTTAEMTAGSYPINGGSDVSALMYIDGDSTVIGENGERMTLVPETDLNHILDELNNLHIDQTSINQRVNELSRENETLWSELTMLRSAYDNQSQNISKLLQFLVTLIQPAAGQTGHPKHQHRFHQTPLRCLLSSLAPPSSSAGGDASSPDAGDDVNRLLQVLVSLAQPPGANIGHGPPMLPHRPAGQSATGRAAKHYLPCAPQPSSSSSQTISGRPAMATRSLANIKLEPPISLPASQYRIGDGRRAYMIAGAAPFCNNNNSCNEDTRLVPSTSKRTRHAGSVGMAEAVNDYGTSAGLINPADLSLTSAALPSPGGPPSTALPQFNTSPPRQSPQTQIYSLFPASSSHPSRHQRQHDDEVDDIGDVDDAFGDLAFASEMKTAAEQIAGESPFELAAFKEIDEDNNGGLSDIDDNHLHAFGM